jgi:uncharacterized repeat protein (TIGR04138 family)
MAHQQRDGRIYDPRAYRFLLEALERTRARLGRQGHVSSAELLAGIQELAQQRYGPLAAAVFQAWGVADGGDFGAMAGDLVDRGVLFRRGEDRIEDFLGGKPYRRIFEEEYFIPDKS